MKYVIAFVRFWYDFIVGDDWQIAAGIVGALGSHVCARACMRVGMVDTPLALVALLSISLWRAATHVLDTFDLIPRFPRP